MKKGVLLLSYITPTQHNAHSGMEYLKTLKTYGNLIDYYALITLSQSSQD